jgi:hypothetical protein
LGICAVWKFCQNAKNSCASTTTLNDGGNGGSERSLQDLSFATVPVKKDQKLHEIPARKLCASSYSTRFPTTGFDQNGKNSCASTITLNDGGNGGSERSLQDLSFATVPEVKDQKLHEIRARKLCASSYSTRQGYYYTTGRDSTKTPKIPAPQPSP